MKRIVLSVLAILMSICVLPELVSAQQGVPVDGKDFFIGYVFPSFNKNPNTSFGRSVAGFFNVYALVSSYEDNNQVRVAYFADDGSEVQTLVKVVSARNA